MSPNSVRLELAFLSHLFAVAIQEWSTGLIALLALRSRNWLALEWH